MRFVSPIYAPLCIGSLTCVCCSLSALRSMLSALFLFRLSRSLHFREEPWLQVCPNMHCLHTAHCPVHLISLEVFLFNCKSLFRTTRSPGAFRFATKPQANFRLRLCNYYTVKHIDIYRKTYTRKAARRSLSRLFPLAPDLLILLYFVKFLHTNLHSVAMRRHN